MQCVKPITLLKEGGLQVPCGKCVGCRISRSREWSTRIMHEMAYHENGSVFITITYSDEHLPDDESLSKNVFRQFIKRLKRRFSDRDLKYFACGEYGEEYGRPHYHAIIFGLSFKELLPKRVNSKTWSSKALEQIWPYGFNVIGSVTYKSARYVADYIGKMDDRPEMWNNRLPPFKLQSQGIGKQWCLDNAEQIKDNMQITLYGQAVGIPKAYQKWLDLIGHEDFKFSAQQRNTENISKAYYRAERDGTGYHEQLEKSNKQFELNMKSRRDLKSKGKF